MVKWIQSWAIEYDLSLAYTLVNFGIAVGSIWVMQCMTRAYHGASFVIWVHRGVLVALSFVSMVCATRPWYGDQAYPWTSDLLKDFVILILLLVWPFSSKARLMIVESRIVKKLGLARQG